MKAVSRFTTLIAIAMTAAHAQAAGSVTVTFDAPDKFADFGRLPIDVETNAREFKRVLTSVAERHLHDGQSIDIEVLDIDLAGALAPGRSDRESRIVSPYDWTRIHLRYRFRTGNAEPVSGDEWLDTKNEPWRAGGEAFSNERRMLDRWFKARFDGK